MNNLRVLLVESELSEARFVQEALAEIEETTHGGAWLHCDVTHLERAEDAVVVLEAQPPDLVLFNPTLNDSRGLATFSAFRDAVPNVPLIAMLDAGEEGLGRRMLRQGAQDYILKNEIDCRPLARALLNAVERQRFCRGTQSASIIDLETGFYNRDGFRDLANRDLRLATACNWSLTLVLAELDNLWEVDAACGREATHDLIVEAANVVRESAGETAVLGRTGLGRFGIADCQRNAEQMVLSLQSGIQAGHHAFAFVCGYSRAIAGTPTIDDLIDEAETVLYENKQTFPNLS